MSNNNAINFPNQTTKTTPTTSDVILISDQADSGKLKKATFGSFPAPTSLISTDNSTTVASFCACMPGALSATQSDSAAQGLAQSILIIFCPFYVGTPWSATQMQTIVKTGFAGSTVTMGIYGSVNGQPSGAVLTAGSATSTSNNTLITATVSASLSANTLYWAALQASATNSNLALTLGKLNVSAPNMFTYSSSTGVWTMQVCYMLNTYSAGTLPTVSGLTITPFNYLPIIRIR